MRTIRLSLYRLYPLPLSPPSKFPTGPRHLRVFSDLAASNYHPLIFSSSLSFSCSSNPIRSLWQHTLASDQVLAFLTNIQRAGITTSLGSAAFRSSLRPNGRRRRENHEPRSSRSRFRPRPPASRFTKSKFRSTRVDGTARDSFVLTARGSRTRKGRSAADRDAIARRIRIAIALPAISVNTSRRIGAGNRRGVRTRGQRRRRRQPLPRSLAPRDSR